MNCLKQDKIRILEIKKQYIPHKDIANEDGNENIKRHEIEKIDGGTHWALDFKDVIEVGPREKQTTAILYSVNLRALAFVSD